MRGSDFLDKMDLVDAAFVEEADKNNGTVEQTYRKRGITMIRRMTALAAVVALMLCSGVVGALAFSKETVVEVPVEQETITFDEIGLTLILPDSWKGEYATEKTEFNEYVVYNPNIRDSIEAETGLAGTGGMLFYIMKWDEQLTKEQVDDGGEWSFAKCEYIMTTQNGTYLLYHASDVQFTNDTLDLYRQMEAEIVDIRFVVDNALDNQ